MSLDRHYEVLYISVYDMRIVGCRNRRQACAFFFTNCLDLWGSVKVGFPVSGKGVQYIRISYMYNMFIPTPKAKKKTPFIFFF